MQSRITHLTLSVLVVLACAIPLAVQAAPQEAGVIVSEGKEVAIQYALSLDGGEVIESNAGAEPLVFVYGAQQIVPGLEHALEGMKIGDSKQVTVQPTEAYGEVQKEAFIEVQKDQIPAEGLEIDAILQARAADGQVMNLRVAEIKDATVVLDANHPLAGKVLYFDVKVLDIREPQVN